MSGMREDTDILAGGDKTVLPAMRMEGGPGVTEQGQACLDLWYSVLARAVDDLLGIGPSDNQKARHKREVRAWFTSPKRTPGSFHWVCTQLGMDQGKARAAIFERAR